MSLYKDLLFKALLRGAYVEPVAGFHHGFACSPCGPGYRGRLVLRIVVAQGKPRILTYFLHRVCLRGIQVDKRGVGGGELCDI